MWSLVCLTTLWASVCVAATDRSESRLHHVLFDGYDPLERPTANASQPITVLLSVALQQLIALDEQTQTVIVNAWLKYTWTDVYLKWDPEKFGGLKDIRIPKMIWSPDVLLYNSIDSNFDSAYPTNFVVYSDGTVNWIPPGIFQISCKIDIKWFPFDEQVCHFKFGSWTYDGTKIDLQPDPIGWDLSDYLPNGEWNISEATVNRSVKYYECCPEPYPDLKFYLRLQRRTIYFGFNLIMPCILITLVTVVGFTLPSNAGEKIALQITIMLSICVFLQILAQKTPPTSEAVPLLGVFFSVCMVVVSASVMSTVVVLNMHYRRPETYVMSNSIRVILLHWLPWLLMMRRPGYILTRASLPSLFADAATTKEHDAKRHKLVTSETLDSRLNNCWKLLAANESEKEKIKPYKAATLLMLQSIFGEIQYITKKTAEEEEDKFAESEWKFAAMVIDRFCLLVFTTFIILSTLVIFGSAPYLLA